MVSRKGLVGRVASALVLLASVLVAAAAPSPVRADTITVGVFNTQLATNLGLNFCSQSTAHSCVESIYINGVEGVFSSSSNPAYRIAGGVYGTQCRFVETTATTCEVPYVVVYPMQSGSTPAVMDESTVVTINMRRPPGTDPTARAGAVVVNGALQSFTPSAPGVRDVATVTMQPRWSELGSTGMCNGWVIAIDGCTVAETATSTRKNSVSVLFLPGMRTSVVPPDVTDPACDPGMSASACIVNVFDSDSQGGWTDTDASIFGLASTDRLSGAAQLKIAGPHYKMVPYDTISTPNPCPNIASICAGAPAGSWGYTITTVPKTTEKELNKAFFRMFLPTAYLYKSFGLKPSEANLETLPVKRTLNAINPVQTTTYTPSAEGLLVDTREITFSMPNMNLSRTFVVKRNKKVTADSIIRAAGLSVSKTLYGTPKITVMKSKGMKKVGSRYVFTKKSSYIGVTLSYQSGVGARQQRILSVKVKK